MITFTVTIKTDADGNVHLHRVATKDTPNQNEEKAACVMASAIDMCIARPEVFANVGYKAIATGGGNTAEESLIRMNIDRDIRKHGE